MMKYFGIAGVLFCAVQLSFGQAKQNVGDFRTLEVTDKIQVELIKSGENEVTLEGQNYENVQVINKNGELRIKMNTLNMLQGNAITVKVYFNSLQEIQAKKGAKVFSTSANVVQSDLLQLNATEGALIDLHVKAKKIDAKSSSGATLALYGHADTQDVISNFGGKYEGKGLKTGIAKVTVNGGGKAEVTVDNTIEAKTRGGGVIDVYGKPEHRVEKKTAGGVINFR